MALTSRRVALPLLAALLVAGAATAFALGGSRNVEAYSSSTWSAAVRLGGCCNAAWRPCAGTCVAPVTWRSRYTAGERHAR